MVLAGRFRCLLIDAPKAIFPSHKTRSYCGHDFIVEPTAKQQKKHSLVIGSMEIQNVSFSAAAYQPALG